MSLASVICTVTRYQPINSSQQNCATPTVCTNCVAVVLHMDPSCRINYKIMLSWSPEEVKSIDLDFSESSFYCASLLLHKVIGCITLTAITAATRLFTHSCSCPCVIARPDATQKLDDWAPRCEEQRCCSKKSVDKTELNQLSSQGILKIIYWVGI